MASKLGILPGMLGRSRNWLIAACWVASVALRAEPAPGQADVVTGYIQAQLDWRLIPGLSVGVLRGGRLERAEAFGLARVASGDSAKVTTVFHLGSVGKQFTAAAILLLAEEGRIGLDDSIGRFVRGGPVAWSRITIRHLLTHTSGLGDYDDSLRLEREYPPEELVALIASQKLAFAPGAGFRYSNAGYVLLGMAVGAASGEHLGDFLARRVFAPLGMATTGMVGRARSPIAGFASGYRLVDGARMPAAAVSRSLNSTGDGSLYSTVLDLAKWDAALYGDAILSAKSRRDMWTPVRLNDGTLRHYGFGWGIASFRDHRILQHGGSWQGFSAHIARYPDDSITVVVLTNLTGVGNTAEIIANRVARYYIPSLRAAAWPRRETITLDPAILDEYAGEFQLGDRRIRVRREHMDLIISVTGRGSARMIPTSRTEFMLDADAVRFRFRARPGRKPDLVVIEGSERAARRVH